MCPVLQLSCAAFRSLEKCAVTREVGGPTRRMCAADTARRRPIYSPTTWLPLTLVHRSVSALAFFAASTFNSHHALAKGAQTLRQGACGG